MCFSDWNTSSMFSNPIRVFTSRISNPLALFFDYDLNSSMMSGVAPISFRLSNKMLSWLLGSIYGKVSTGWRVRYFELMKPACFGCFVWSLIPQPVQFGLWGTDCAISGVLVGIYCCEVSIGLFCIYC